MDHDPPSSGYGIWSHLHTLWLFTFSDFKTMLGPETVFGIVSSLAGPVLTTDKSPRLEEVLRRLPHTIIWAWINLLPFDIDNQRRPSSIQEDRINKPWRPLPSGRITPAQAQRLMQISYPMAILASAYLGGLQESIELMFLGWLYNELGWANDSCILRNFANALGFVWWGSGAFSVAVNINHSTTSMHSSAYQWLSIIGGIVFTTIHMQDMPDQAGDRAISRSTVPLVIGDRPARWTIAVGVLFWTWFCPAFWRLHLGGYVFQVVTGSIIVVRVLLYTSLEADKLTFKFWNLWMVGLYCLPLVKRLSKSDA